MHNDHRRQDLHAPLYRVLIKGGDRVASGWYYFCWPMIFLK